MLLVRNVPGALLIGILVITAIGIPLGVTNFKGIIDTPPSIAPIFMKFEWTKVFTFDMAICVFTFLFIDIFDTMGTLIGVSNRAGMVAKDGTIHGLNKAFMADAIGTTAGAMLGTSTITTFVESAAGVNAGGRSGLTAFVTALCFIVALVFAPLFLAIPSQATAPVLVLVGVMMMHDIKEVNFSDYIDAIPAFICIAFMPFAYSISEGILLGLVTYVLIRVISGKWKELNVGMIILAILFILRYALIK